MVVSSHRVLVPPALSSIPGLLDHFASTARPHPTVVFQSPVGIVWGSANQRTDRYTPRIALLPLPATAEKLYGHRWAIHISFVSVLIVLMLPLALVAVYLVQQNHIPP